MAIIFHSHASLVPMTVVDVYHFLLYMLYSAHFVSVHTLPCVVSTHSIFFYRKGMTVDCFVFNFYIAIFFFFLFASLFLSFFYMVNVWIKSMWLAINLFVCKCTTMYPIYYWHKNISVILFLFYYSNLKFISIPLTIDNTSQYKCTYRYTCLCLNIVIVVVVVGIVAVITVGRIVCNIKWQLDAKSNQVKNILWMFLCFFF